MEPRDSGQGPGLVELTVYSGIGRSTYTYGQRGKRVYQDCDLILFHLIEGFRSQIASLDSRAKSIEIDETFCFQDSYDTSETSWHHKVPRILYLS